VCVEITLCFQKLHSCVCSSHYACENHTMRVNITHKSDFYTQSVVSTGMSVIKCVEIRVISVVITFCVSTSHSAGGNCTLHINTLVRVEFTLCVQKLNSSMWSSQFACVYHTLCVWCSSAIAITMILVSNISKKNLKRLLIILKNPQKSAKILKNPQKTLKNSDLFFENQNTFIKYFSSFTNRKSTSGYSTHFIYLDPCSTCEVFPRFQ
jgi:hypothetical protein